MNCCVDRAATKAIKEEAFLHCLGLLERLLLSPEPQHNPRLSVRPAAQLRLCRGCSAKASYGEFICVNIQTKEKKKKKELNLNWILLILLFPARKMTILVLI